MAQSNRSIGRSIGAVVAGIIVAIVLSVGTDLLLQNLHIFPKLGDPVSDSLLLLATVYRTFYSIVAAYVTARLAPNRPMMHALAGGMLGVIVGGIGAIATWNREPGIGHHWYAIALVVLALPCAWVGGKIRTMQSPLRSEA